MANPTKVRVELVKRLSGRAEPYHIVDSQQESTCTEIREVLQVNHRHVVAYYENVYYENTGEDVETLSALGSGGTPLADRDVCPECMIGLRKWLFGEQGYYE